MSDQNSTLKILSYLNVIGTLSAGKTLSTTSMQVIDHNSWTGSIWRKYTGENRATTIDNIKGILNEAIFTLETGPSSEFEMSLINALNGFETLIETYKGDYYTQNNIQKTLDNIRERISLVSLPTNDDDEPNDLIALVVQEQLQVADQQSVLNNMTIESSEQPFRICAQPDSTSQGINGLRSVTNFSNNNVSTNIETVTELPKVSQELNTTPLVEASNRTSDQTTDKTAINSTDAGRGTKIAANLPSGNTDHINKEFGVVCQKNNKKRELIERNQRLQKLSHPPCKASKENNHAAALKHQGRYYHQ